MEFGAIAFVSLRSETPVKEVKTLALITELFSSGKAHLYLEDEIELKVNSYFKGMQELLIFARSQYL
jgi:hypothetical protein